MTIHVVFLSPKTPIGEKILSQAKNPVNKHNPLYWRVLDQKEIISFTDQHGPWVFVRPDWGGSEYTRWVHLYEDKDFNVEILR